MLTFQFAHLQRGDADESVQSSAAWPAFGLPLGTLIVIAITVPQVKGAVSVPLARNVKVELKVILV